MKQQNDLIEEDGVLYFINLTDSAKMYLTASEEMERMRKLMLERIAYSLAEEIMKEVENVSTNN